MDKEGIKDFIKPSVGKLMLAVLILLLLPGISYTDTSSDPKATVPGYWTIHNFPVRTLLYGLSMGYGYAGKYYPIVAVSGVVSYLLSCVIAASIKCNERLHMFLKPTWKKIVLAFMIFLIIPAPFYISYTVPHGAMYEDHWEAWPLYGLGLLLGWVLAVLGSARPQFHHPFQIIFVSEVLLAYLLSCVVLLLYAGFRKNRSRGVEAV